MRFDKLTTKFQQVIARAQAIAMSSGHPYADPMHLFLAQLEDADQIVAEEIASSGGDVQNIKNVKHENRQTHVILEVFTQNGLSVQSLGKNYKKTS